MKLSKFILLLGILLIAQFAMAQEPPVSKKFKIHVEGKCAMCSDRIQTFAILTTGVMKAEYDLDRQILSVTANKNTFDKNQLHQNLANAGHGTNKIKADEEAYTNLPACCQYAGPPEASEKLNGNIIEYSPMAWTV